MFDYHFITKELAEELEGQFTCLGENTEKYLTFSTQVEKEVKRIGKNREEVTKTIYSKLKFIDSAGFMTNSLSNLVNNHAEGIHLIKHKYGHDNKTCEKCGINDERIIVS